MESVTADHNEDTDWGDDDPSVFLTNNVGGLEQLQQNYLKQTT
jgi:hypothetical protein